MWASRFPHHRRRRDEWGTRVRFEVGVSAEARMPPAMRAKGGQGREAVVLLAAGDAEEDQNNEGPEGDGEGGFALAGGDGVVVAEVAAEMGDGGGKEGRPGEDPDGGVEPEEPDGGVAVVVGDALAEEAGEVLVVEVKPGPPGAGGRPRPVGMGMAGFRRAARMCQGRAMTAKTAVRRGGEVWGGGRAGG